MGLRQKCNFHILWVALASHTVTWQLQGQIGCCSETIFSNFLSNEWLTASRNFTHQNLCKRYLSTEKSLKGPAISITNWLPSLGKFMGYWMDPKAGLTLLQGWEARNQGSREKTSSKFGMDPPGCPKEEVETQIPNFTTKAQSVFISEV